MTSVSIDGISTLNTRFNGPVRDLFPSVEGISEFKVSSSGNNAEFGQVTDITTTSKIGPAPGGFSAENGPTTLNYFDIASDYGNAVFTRRNRLSAPFFGSYRSDAAAFASSSKPART